MVTTIQVSNDLQDELNKRKIFDRETYEEVIWDILEDTMEFSEKTKKDILQAEKDIYEGRVHTLKEVRKSLLL